MSAIKYRELPRKNYEQDFLPFISNYNYNIRDKRITIGIDCVNVPGMLIGPETTSAIEKVKFPKLIGRIVFFSNRGKNEVKELSRHLRNVISHPENIKTAEINGKVYCRLLDIDKSSKKATMKGLIPLDEVKILINEIIRNTNSYGTQSIKQGN